MKMPLYSYNRQPVVKIHTNITTRPVFLPLDTGAQTILLKGDVLKADTKYYPHNYVELVGISGQWPRLEVLVLLSLFSANQANHL